MQMAKAKTTTRRKPTTKRAAARKTTAPTLTRRQVISQLRKGVVQITFRKQDGTNRVVLGTLSQNEVPLALNDVERNGGDVRGVVTVWSVEDEGFRSFRLDSLRKFKLRS
jgi:hypothetical protein